MELKNRNYYELFEYNNKLKLLVKRNIDDNKHKESEKIKFPFIMIEFPETKRSNVKI